MSHRDADDGSVDPRLGPATDLLDALPDPLALLDVDGTIVHANHRLEAVLDVKPGALEGRPFADVVTDGDVDDLLRRWRATNAAVPGGATLCTAAGEEVRVRADGCRQPSLDLLLVRFRVRGDVGNGFSRLRDEVETSNLRQLRDRLQRSLQEQAEANARLARVNEDLDRYAAIVSHDLRAPLALIRSSIDLARGADTVEERGELLDMADRAATQMGQVIEQLLALARLGNAEPPEEPVDPAESVEDVLRTFAVELREAGADVTLEELPPVAIQPTHLRQALQNLLANSLRFRSPDRALTISFSGHVEPGGTAVIAVADNGVGIDPAEHEHIFEPMVRGSNASGREGTGLGLAVVRRICRAYGGEIAIADRDGPGATFLLMLPGPHDGDATGTGEHPA